MNYDCIVIYAEKDQKFVRKLVKRLHKVGIKVWFDESELVAGDISRRKIGEALREVNHAVVILSAHFFKVEKLKRDLEVLCLREEDSGALVILPVRHEVTEAEVKKYMPAVAEKHAIQSNGDAERVAQDLCKAMRMKSAHDERPPLPEKDADIIINKLKRNAWKITAVIAILAASASLIKAYEDRQSLQLVEAESVKLKQNNDELNKQRQTAEEKLHKLIEKHLDYQEELHEMGYRPLPQPSPLSKPKAPVANSILFGHDTTHKNDAPVPFSPPVQPSGQPAQASADSGRTLRCFVDDAVRVIEFDLVAPKAIPNVPRHDSLEVSREYGGRDRESVHAIILKHNPAIQDLYKNALKTTPGITGKLTIRFTIGANGHVIEVEVIESSELPQELLDAIFSKMLEWKDFGESEENIKESKYRLTYTFGYQN